MVYSLLYTAGADSRWYEAGHRTAFKNQLMNNFVYQVACFLLFRKPVLWRWGHSRHHTDKIIVGRDAELATMRLPDLIKVAMLFFCPHTFEGLRATLRHAVQGLNEEEREFTPPQYVNEAQKIARVTDY